MNSFPSRNYFSQDQMRTNTLDLQKYPKWGLANRIIDLN
jgi:hypothetical protein